MKRALYPRLALSGIRKNARLYLPALCADAGMAMVCYIVACLRDSSSVASMRGGAVVTGTLSFGVYVIAVFSLLFLLYTNAFLIRRRKREFGKASVSSQLDGVPGVGEKRKRALLKHFQTAQALRSATVDEIAVVVPRPVAEAVHEMLHAPESGD